MFRYPLDSGEILRKKRTLRKQLTEKEPLFEKRIAILSGSTIGEITNILELFLLDAGIKPVFYEGGFNRYFEELVFDNKDLLEFAPDIIYIHTGIHNLLELPSAANGSTAQQLMVQEWDRIKSILD